MRNSISPWVTISFFARGLSRTVGFCSNVWYRFPIAAILSCRSMFRFTSVRTGCNSRSSAITKDITPPIVNDPSCICHPPIRTTHAKDKPAIISTMGIAVAWA